MKRRALARRVPRLVASICFALACESTYYDEYRARHPDLGGGGPREGAALEEVLAALHAPSGVETIRVEIIHLEIAQVDQNPWRDLSFDAIRAGSWVSSDAAGYAVLVTWRCGFTDGLHESATVRVGYYLLRDNQLGARDHYAFRDRCTWSNEFVAAREGFVAVEREAMRRISARRGATRLGLSQAYRRGLAYVEAGRLEDASAMLVVGERGYRAGTARLQVGTRAPDAVIEATRLRASLMRALGVEPK